jgi:hypothetical protein
LVEAYTSAYQYRVGFEVFPTPTPISIKLETDSERLSDLSSSF